MDFPKYGALVQSLKVAIRDTATTIPNFSEKEHGAVRLLACPFSPIAHEWLGCSGEFDPDDIPDIEDSFAILPKSNRIAIFHEDKVIVIDTYSMTAMKISWLSRTQELTEPIEVDIKELIYVLQNLGFMSFAKEDILSSIKTMEQLISILKDVLELQGENGFASWRGAVCCKVAYDGEPFAYFYASVSGAEQDEDLACAMSAVEVVKTFFSDPHFTVVGPTPKAIA